MADSKAVRPTQAQVVDISLHRARVLSRRDALITSHLSLVDQIARQIAARLPPSFDLADLVAAGNVALTQAALRYRPRDHGGAPFSAYARIVVRGAILDSVSDRRYEEATRPPLASAPEPQAAPEIEAAIDSARLRRRVTAAIALLPDRERAVITAYYGPEEPTFPAIASALRISPTRASQLHARAVDRLRGFLREA